MVCAIDVFVVHNETVNNTLKIALSFIVNKILILSNKSCGKNLKEIIQLLVLTCLCPFRWAMFLLILDQRL